MTGSARQRLTRRIQRVITRSRKRLARLGATPSSDHSDDGNTPGDDSGRVQKSSERLQKPSERILSILTECGGRARQSELVAAVDWSESTVSRELCELESAGDVVRHEIGREKLVFLPEEVPESADSPFTHDDEAETLVA